MFKSPVIINNLISISELLICIARDRNMAKQLRIIFKPCFAQLNYIKFISLNNMIQIIKRSCHLSEGQSPNPIHAMYLHSRLLLSPK